MLSQKVNLGSQVTGSLQQSYSGIDTGAANAYAVNISAGLTSLFFGLTVTWQAANASTGASTFTLGSFPTAPLIHNDGTAIASSDIAVGSIYTVVWDTANWRITSSLIAASFSGTAGGCLSGSYPNPALAKLTDIPWVKLTYKIASGGGNGGTFTAGSRQTVPLNTKDTDTGSICTLASNQFAIPAGTYRINWFMTGLTVEAFTSYIYNITDSAILTQTGSANPLIGSANYSPSSATPPTYSEGQGEFTIAGTKTFELSGVCQATSGGNYGFGSDMSLGVNNIYAQVILEKIA